MNVEQSFVDLIGNTPLLRLRRASEETGCEIYGKCEFHNPGQSVKDRAALFIIRDAEAKGQLNPGRVIVEGTAGNTGIGIALVGNALGYRSVIVMPETQSQEKKDMLRMCGADLRLVPAVPYKDPMNYVRYSGRLAEEIAAEEPNGAIWANQFDNQANRQAHIAGTGPEIWRQTDGKVDAFTCAIGTGGTLAGVGIALKERNPDIRIVLSDPMGSGMYGIYTQGEPKPEGNSITEGIGQGRVTGNLEDAPIDDAQQVTDPEALDVIFGLVREEGLVMGGSTGINVAGAIKLAREMGPGHTIVTVLCDYGDRYASKIFNPEFLRSKDLPVPEWLDAGPVTEPLFREDAYVRECDAVVLAVDDRGIVLDRTVFYPRGGGQPGDIGTFSHPGGATTIVDTVKGEGADEILHLPEAGAPLPAIGATVRAEIDWERRYRLMRMHSCLHLLSALVPGAVTGGQVGIEKSRLDFDIPDGGLDKVELTAGLNRLVAEDHTVVPRWVSDADLDANPDLVKTMSVAPPRGAGRVRLIAVEGVDLQACGGTHVAQTGEIGPVKVTKIENKGRHNRRVNIAFDE